MVIEVLDNGWISDSFQIGETPFVFNDAIVMPADEYNALTQDEINIMKQQRYDNWIAIVQAPPTETEN